MQSSSSRINKLPPLPPPASSTQLLPALLQSNPIQPNSLHSSIDPFALFVHLAKLSCATVMKSMRQSSGGGSVVVAGGGAGETSSAGGGCKMERKDVEKNRRLHMKGLCLKLSSLIPNHHHRHRYSSPPSTNKDAITQQDQLDSAAAYIKQLKGRIDELKRRKQGVVGHVSGGGAAEAGVSGGSNLPVIEVRYQDATLDVALVSEAGKPFKLHEVITVLEQEGAEVVSASFSVVGDKIFYTLHSQALSSRIGLEAARVSHRLESLVPAAAV